MTRLRSRSHRLLLTGFCCLLPVAGCKPGALGPAKQYTQIDYAHGGTITGTVHFSKPAPSPVPIDMAQDPVCAMSGDSMTDAVVVNHGALANVLVYIQSGTQSGLGSRTYPVTRTPVVIDQKGCQFLPHVAAAMVGQQVEFTNSDNTLHNVHMAPTVAGNMAFDITQRPHGDPAARYFHAQELMIPIRCNNHPWMHSYLNVLDNPFFAVTDKDGNFSIQGLPAGTYTLTAVQEQFGQKSVTVNVGPGGKLRQSFTY